MSGEEKAKAILSDIYAELDRAPKATREDRYRLFNELKRLLSQETSKIVAELIKEKGWCFLGPNPLRDEEHGEYDEDFNYPRPLSFEGWDDR